MGVYHTNVLVDKIPGCNRGDVQSFVVEEDHLFCEIMIVCVYVVCKYYVRMVSKKYCSTKQGISEPKSWGMRDARE